MFTGDGCGALQIRFFTFKLFKSERPDGLGAKKILARLIPHRLIYIMDRHMFKQIQDMHKISSDLGVTEMMEHISRSARKPKPLETWGQSNCRW